MFDVETAARMYRVPIVDYGGKRAGVLLGSGCGLMMSLMDEVAFRYCIDLDDLRIGGDAQKAYALEQFTLVANARGGIALAGWFSITNPEPFVRAFANLTPAGLVYGGCTRLAVPGEVSTLQEFTDAATRRWGSAKEAS